jgi:hypothetical protein
MASYMTVVSRHIGRAGNNLFQIAAAIGYARKYGYQWAVDPSNGHGEPYSAIHKVFPNLPKAEPSGVRYHEHPRGNCPQHGTPYDYCHFDYHDIPDLGPNVVLTGFYQSWKYFEHCKDEVKEVFKLPHVEGYEDYVSIHVRRGDYVQHSGSFPPITAEYIASAYSSIPDNVRGRNVIIFSDDIKWCKEHILYEGINVQFSEGRSELEDLSLMASCGHHIIANSSFSYWGAYLGHNPNRIVISPSAETWFGETSGVKKPVTDLILPSWIQIPTR